MNPFRAAACLVCLGLLGAAGCSGDDFASDPTDGGAGADAGSSGGSSGSSGTGGSGGGSSGTSGSSGSAGSTTGGAGGAAGAPACTKDSCGEAKYCNEDGTCRSCGEIKDDFSFDTPQPLAAINSAHTGELRAPRFVKDKTITYTVGAVPSDRKIWSTDDFLTSKGAPMGVPVDGDPLGESDALVTLPAADGPLGGYVMLFDRTDVDGWWSGRTLFGAKPNSGATAIEAVEPLQAPFNDAASDWSIAFAVGIQRAWWMSTRGTGAARLHTVSTSMGVAQVPQPVPLATDKNCSIDDLDLSPWVHPLGGLLLFHTAERYAGCAKGSPSTTDLYVATLEAGGQASQAYPLDVNLQGIDDLSPSLSPDLCLLFFSSKRNGASKPELYIARRK